MCIVSKDFLSESSSVLSLPTHDSLVLLCPLQKTPAKTFSFILLPFVKNSSLQRFIILIQTKYLVIIMADEKATTMPKQTKKIF